MAWASVGDEPYEGFSVVENKITGTGRWTTNYSLVVKKDDQFFHSRYRTGATENQDESPFEFDGELIEFKEVIPVETIVIEYKLKE